jgi:HSP20 family molecular chaperone IbpA
METIKKKTTMVGVATLIVGLALGLGIGVWGIRSIQASSPAAPKAQTAPKAEAQEPSVARGEEWNPFREMERMQQEIDRVIRNATEQFQIGPSASVFRPDAGHSSSFDLRDRKDHFELRAYLPDAEASDVNVKIDNDKTLHVSVGHKKQEVKKDKATEARVTELGRYEQVITLPEAVNSADMKVERNGHEVVITIPKAKTT